MTKNIYTKRQKILQELLRDARKDAGFTQVELAGSLKQPQSYVSKYELGERRLDIIEVYDICKVLGIKFRDFAQSFEKRIQ